MDPRLAIFFAAVAEEQSFTRAAARLNIAQPWLSAQIRRLEDQLGYQLFYRTKGPIELTPEGERLFPTARDLAQNSEKLREISRAIGADVAQAVHVGAHASSAGVPEFGRLNEDFTAKFREHNLVVTAGVTADLVDGVAGGRLDAALVLEPIGNRGFDVVVLREQGPYILMPKSSPLALYEQLGPDDLSGHTLGVIQRMMHPEFYDALTKPLVEAGVQLKPVPEGNFHAMEHFARAQRIGVIMIDGDERSFDADTELVARPMLAPPIRYVLIKRSDAEKRALRRYWQAAKALAISSLAVSAT
jgi:LysR family transcriptional regulator, benzoate and cis,cis-muconate-responsive activator of ben and cat genes